MDKISNRGEEDYQSEVFKLYKMTFPWGEEALVPSSFAQKNEQSILGKYGTMRAKFLKEQYPSYYALKMQEGTLGQELLEMNDMATGRAIRITQELLKIYPGPDKRDDYQAYLIHVDNMSKMAEEFVIEDLVYTSPSEFRQE